VELNNIGEYVAFSSLWYHHGYYNVLSNKTFFTAAQLFVMPTVDASGSKRLTQKHQKVDTYIEEPVDESSLESLTQYLFVNWDSTYAADLFLPAKTF
jgi:hypothetical protein